MISGDKQAPLVVDFRWATSPEEVAATPLLEAAAEPAADDAADTAPVRVWQEEAVD
jgi:hypothetical protein